MVCGTYTHFYIQYISACVMCVPIRRVFFLGLTWAFRLYLSFLNFKLSFAMRYFSGPPFLGSKVLIAACCWHKRTSNSQGPSSQTFVFCVGKFSLDFLVFLLPGAYGLCIVWVFFMYIECHLKCYTGKTKQNLTFTLKGLQNFKLSY